MDEICGFCEKSCPHNAHTTIFVAQREGKEILLNCRIIDSYNENNNPTGCIQLHLVGRGCPYLTEGRMLAYHV